MRNTNCSILNAPNTSDQTGASVDAQQLVSASFMVFFGDATANGTLNIQASNDPCPFGNQAFDFTPTNWANIPNAAYTANSGANGLIVIPNMCFRWIRASWIFDSGGSDGISVNMNALSI